MSSGGLHPHCPRGRLVPQAQRVLPALPALQALRVQVDLQVRLVLQGLLVQPVHRVQPGPLARKDQLVLKVQLE
jgi:hypothetical protein